MKNSLTLLVIAVMWCQLAFTQSRIFGKVFDGSNQDVMIGAIVSLKDSSMGTSTDFEGNYELSLENGSYVIMVSFMGYDAVEQRIQVDGKDIVLNFTLEETAIMKETIIVTDGKYEKKLEESTVSIDVINKRQIEANNITSLDELVKKASGVEIIDGQISIRGGAGYAYGAGSRVLFLVDGQPLLSAELSEIKWNFMPFENAEQVEIIKGSASVLYGSSALNGVVNLRTAYPVKDKPYTSFSLYGGIYEQPPVDSMRWFDSTYSPSQTPFIAGMYFAHREKIKDNFDLVIGGNIHFKNGFQKGVDERRFRFNYNTRYRLPKSDGKVSLGINGNIMYHEEGRYFLSKDMQENAYINISNITRDKYLTITIDPYLTIFDNADNKHELKTRYFTVGKYLSDNTSFASIYSAEYQFYRKFPNDWIFTAGTMGQFYDVNSVLFADSNNMNSNEVILVNAGTFAAYSQLDKKFFDRLSMTVGVRWEGFVLNKTFTPTLPVFRAGINFEASNYDFIRFSFGQGFRFPSLAERFIFEYIPLDGPLQIGVFPNEEIKPESGWNTELGYRHKFNLGKFSMYADIALFWMEYDNMVEFTLGSYPEGLGFKSLNVAKARIAGWEISTMSEGKIGKVPLWIWAGYTFNCPVNLNSVNSDLRDPGKYLEFMFKTFAGGVGTNNLDNILKYRSLHTFRFDVQTAFKNITLGTALNYTSHMLNIDLLFTFDIITKGVSAFRTIHNKGFWVWDIRLGYQISPKSNLNFIIQNALNEEYAPRPAQMGTPRTYTLKYNHVF